MRTRFHAFGFIVAAIFSVNAQQDFGTANTLSPITRPANALEGDTLKDSLPPIEEAPRIAHFVNADFPDSLIEKGVSGVVMFDLLISATGTVDSAAVVNGLHPVLDTSALKAVRMFRFTPAISQGKPVPVVLRYAYKFIIEDKTVNTPKQVNFRGTIREKGTREKLANVNIAVSFGRNFEDGRIIATMDSLGGFSFIDLPEGTVRTKIIASGYKPITKDVCIKKGKALRQSFWLERDSYNDNEIVVYGQAPDEEIQSYEVGPKELKRVAGFNGEAVKLLQALPGVARPFFGGNEIIVRGADNSDSKFYVDGIELPYLYHDMSYDFLMYRGILNTDALQSVSLFPGGWGVGYGNAIGGIIDLKTREAQKDRWHGMLDLNIKGLNFLFETPLWKNAGIIGSFRGNFLFDEVGFFDRHVLGEKNDNVQDYWDYSLRFDWQLSRSNHIAITTIGAMDTSYQFTSQWQQSIKHDPSVEASSFGKSLKMLIASWTFALSPECRNLLTYGIRPTSFKTLENESQDYMYNADSKALRQDVHDEFKCKIHEGLNLTCGLDLRFEPFTSLSELSTHDTVYSYATKSMFGPLAAYLSCEWKPLDKLTLTPGLRYDYYTQLDYHGTWLPEFWDYSSKFINNQTRFSGDPSLRISGKYQLDAKRALTASIGNYNESPDSMIMVIGRPNGVSSEKASQYTLGYEWKMGDIVSLDCQGYVGRQWDKFRWKTSEEIAENGSSYFADNGLARMEGLELMLRHLQTSHFFGWISYALSYSERYDFSAQKWVEYDYNSLNNIQLVANWFFKGNQGLGVRFQYTDGYPYTPYVVQLYDATYFQYIAKQGALNSKHFPPYLGLDLRYEKKFIFKRSMLTAYIEGERLLHILQYVKDKNGNPVYSPGEYNQYNYDFSGFESQPIWPMASLGVTWEF
jgi:TonB family protein